MRKSKRFIIIDFKKHEASLFDRRTKGDINMPNNLMNYFHKYTNADEIGKELDLEHN